MKNYLKLLYLAEVSGNVKQKCQERMQKAFKWEIVYTYIVYYIGILGKYVLKRLDCESKNVNSTMGFYALIGVCFFVKMQIPRSEYLEIGHNISNANDV